MERDEKKRIRSFSSKGLVHESDVHVNMSVRNILENYAQGKHKKYDIFVTQIADSDIQPAVLTSHLRGLSEAITLLGDDFAPLIGVVLKLDWVRYDAHVILAYQTFILNLLSAHTSYLQPCLRMVIRYFFGGRLPKSQGDADGPTEEDVCKKDAVTFSHIHLLLKAISKLVPFTPRVLLPMLIDLFPFRSKPAYTQECYVRNVLHVTQYVPSHRQQILEVIVDRMVRLDTRSPRHEIVAADDHDLDDEDDNEIDQDIFDMECEEAHKEAILSGRCDSPPRSPSPMGHEGADRLDRMMHVVLSYIHSTCHNPAGGTLDWERTKMLYREMLLIFEKVILPTHATCHVQFIMFFICSFRESLCEGFIDFLWKKLCNPNTEPVYRQAAVAYIASLLSRAQYITASTAQICVSLLCKWIHQYIEHTSYSTHHDMVHHGTFYSVCQAVLYIFTFRHKEILETTKGYKWAGTLNLQTIVTCRLNPLKMCSTVIVRTFASITRMHQLCFCDSVIERNNRMTLPVTSSGPTSGQTASNLLETFFPFDPYILSRSSSLVHPLYREFEGNILDDNNTDIDNEEDDFLPEPQTQSVPVIDELLRESSFTGEKNIDLMNYGVSPGYKQSNHSS